MLLETVYNHELEQNLPRGASLLLCGFYGIGADQWPLCGVTLLVEPIQSLRAIQPLCAVASLPAFPSLRRYHFVPARRLRTSGWR